MTSRRVATRLDRLAEQYGLPPQARDRFAELLEALADEIAPTTVHEPRQGVDVHIADSLVALDIPAVRGAPRIADLGAGAGLPTLALAIALPDARVSALESVGRKAAFVTATAERLELTNVDVVNARVEEWAEGAGACDVVCARALASLPVLVEYAAPPLRLGGTFVAWKGTVEPQELADGAAAASAVGLEPREVLAVEPFPASRHRTLHVYCKVMETPARFPRRAGMAAKRPLSAPKQHRVAPRVPESDR